MKKYCFIFSFIVLILGCKSFNQKSQSINADSTIATINQVKNNSSKHKAFLSRFYQFDNDKMGYMPHVILRKPYSFEKDFEKILELSNKSITRDEYSRKLFPKSIVDQYFEFDNLDTLAIVSFNGTFKSKAFRSDIEYYENNIEGQYITSFELLQQPSEDYQDIYAYKIWDNNLIKTVKVTFQQQQDSVLDKKILKSKNIDPKYFYKSEQWINNDSKILYGFISYSVDGFTNYASIMYKLLNDSIVFEKEFNLSPLVIWSLFPSSLKYNDEYVLLVKFAEPDTDYIVDYVIYFNGETFIQGEHNMID